MTTDVAIKTAIAMFADTVSWCDANPIIDTPEYRAAATAEWDKLYTYIHANFTAPVAITWTGKPGDYGRQLVTCDDAVLKETRTILDSLVEDQKSTADDGDILFALCTTFPPHFLAVILPVAMGRYLIRNGVLGFNYRDTTTFGEFFNRYGEYILSA